MGAGRQIPAADATERERDPQLGHMRPAAACGKSAVVFSSPAAFSTLLRQDVGGLSASRYTASIRYKRLSNINGAQFSVTVRRRVNGIWETPYRARSPLKTSTTWTQAVLDNIPISDGDVLQFGVWMNLGPGGALCPDDGRLQ